MSSMRIDHGPELRRMIDGVIREAFPRAGRLIEDETKRLMKDAEDAWPVSPDYHPNQLKNMPHSRDLFRVVRTIRPPNEVVVGIVNTAAYFLFIKTPREVREDARGLSRRFRRLASRKGKSVPKLLLFDPADKSAERLATELQTDVAAVH